MPAYLIVKLTFRDLAWGKAYMANVPAILRSFGGEYHAVSKRVERIEGEAPTPDQVALFTFPSIELINAFMTCEAYQPYKDMRIAGSDADIIAFET
jgi:uncharacterized protein (DUF1330 family)